ncbi:glycosyltransferase family 39 protein [Kamptonema formosum]|uniref:glycosyltransferase family 39 protein n=1 Tax=Kamptonema formosum TaxID=331992 RepID=UPI000375DFB3|nr:glycosyltransferase family 39 protein [Oscillatoria sp. PCC 10802]
MTSKLRLLIAVLLAVGIFFRFFNLDGKFYWYDEVFTSLRISGYTEAEAVQQVARGQVITIEDLQKYQRPNPEKSVTDTIKGLAQEEPQLTPLYFVIARFWVQGFGHSVAVTRSLSALISLLAFPCIYWLCLELFQSSLTGWVACALLAVSPFHVLYAQEARPYSLWTVTVLLANASLLRAMRLKRVSSWGIYAATVSLGLYTHFLSVLVVIGHGIYVGFGERWRVSARGTAFLLASGAALLTFLPWIAIAIANSAKVATTTSWLGLQTNVQFLIINWAANISRLFFDFGLKSDAPLIYLIPLIPGILIILALLACAIYCLCRHTPKHIWLFILTSIAVTALALILPDIIWGGIRSTKSRYLLPSYLGLQLAVAYFFATKLSSWNSRRQKLWQILAVALLSSGVLSCAISSQADTWWNKEWGYYNPKIARIINQAPAPLVISNLSEASLGNVVSLSYLLNHNSRFQLAVNPNTPKISPEFTNVFVYRPSLTFRTQILEVNPNSKIEPIYPKKPRIWLWKLVKIS